MHRLNTGQLRRFSRGASRVKESTIPFMLRNFRTFLFAFHLLFPHFGHSLLTLGRDGGELVQDSFQSQREAWSPLPRGWECTVHASRLHMKIAKVNQ